LQLAAATRPLGRRLFRPAGSSWLKVVPNLALRVAAALARGGVPLWRAPVVARLRNVAGSPILRTFVDRRSLWRGEVAVSFAVLTPRREGAGGLAVSRGDRARLFAARSLGGGLATVCAAAVAPIALAHFRDTVAAAERPRDLVHRRTARKVHANVRHGGGPPARPGPLRNRRLFSLLADGFAVGLTWLICFARGAVAKDALLFRIHSHVAPPADHAARRMPLPSDLRSSRPTDAARVAGD
jgi:hypothetical protein